MSKFTKKAWVNTLIKTAKYTSGWIEAASDILSYEESPFELAQLEEFNENQLSIIRDAIRDKVNINLDKLANKSLNATQMQLYLLGISKGVPEEKMDTFLNPYIPYAKSNYIIQSMIEGNDELLKYIDFDVDQIYEIYAGMKDGIDYKVYAIKELRADTMSIARHCMNAGRAVEIYEDNTLVTKIHTEEDVVESDVSE